MKKRLQRAMALLLAVVMVFLLENVGIKANAEDETGGEGSARAGNITTVTSSQGYTEAGYGFGVGKFSVSGVDGKSYSAYCACHEKALPSNGMQMQTSVCTNANIRKVLFYGKGGPGDSGYSYTQTAVAISVANGHMDSEDTGESENAVGRPVLAAISSLPNPGDDFVVYYAYSTNASMQDLVYFSYNPTGKLVISKESSLTELSGENTSYRMEGAQYGIFTDTECTQSVGIATIDENGMSNPCELKAGSYFVKETKRPNGYALDQTIYSTQVNSAQTTTLSVKEMPQNNKIKLLLSKYDNEKNCDLEGNTAQGAASLENAEYEVKFYGGQYSSEAELMDKTPLRSWILKTDSKGQCCLSEEYLISGDDFWRDSTGAITLPLGTVSIQEKKASEGYCLNEELFIRNITSEGELETVNSYQVLEAPEEVIRGDLEILKFYEPEDKKADTLRPIEGVEFTITSNTTNKVVMKIVTDKDGKATTKSKENKRGSLVYDHYTITETKTPKGYDKIRPFEVVIDQNQMLLTGIYKQDTLISSPIQVVKVDRETGKVIPVAGAAFQLLNEQKEIISMTSHYPKEQVLDTFETDENGQFVFPEMINAGIYYLKEIKAPEGYLLNEEEVEFEIAESTDWEHPVVIRMEDESAKGVIALHKTDEDTKEALGGATFEISAAEDIVTPDGTLREKKGTVVDTVTTDENGQAASKELYFGIYYVKEVKAPQGYVLDEKKHEVILSYKDQVTSFVTKELEITNKANRFRIVKKKAGTEEPLEGVEFAIWDEVKNNDSDELGNTIVNEQKFYITDENGEIIWEHIPAGTYCAMETKALQGYLLDAKVYQFVVDENGHVNEKEEEIWEVQNDFTKVCISKVDITNGEELPGATLQIIDTEGNIIEEWVSEKEPHMVEALAPGYYDLRETIAPEGYQIANDVMFTVEETGEIQSVVMKDELVKKDVPKKEDGKPKTVKTGDESFYMLWIALLIVSGLFAFRMRKKNK